MYKLTPNFCLLCIQFLCYITDPFQMYMNHLISFSRPQINAYSAISQDRRIDLHPPKFKYLLS